MESSDHRFEKRKIHSAHKNLKEEGKRKLSKGENASLYFFSQKREDHFQVVKSIRKGRKKGEETGIRTQIAWEGVA